MLQAWKESFAGRKAQLGGAERLPPSTDWEFSGLTSSKLHHEHFTLSRLVATLEKEMNYIPYSHLMIVRKCDLFIQYKSRSRKENPYRRDYESMNI